MTITWGGIKFDGPTKATEWDPPQKAAIYSIMRKPDEKTKPNTYRIMYFGESGNLEERGFWKSHHKYECFKVKVGAVSNIYIGIHAMPGSTQDERKAVEDKLLEEYNPECQD